jgi:hypothetical protein
VGARVSSRRGSRCYHIRDTIAVKRSLSTVSINCRLLVLESKAILGLLIVEVVVVGWRLGFLATVKVVDVEKVG